MAASSRSTSSMNLTRFGEGRGMERGEEQGQGESEREEVEWQR